MSVAIVNECIDFHDLPKFLIRNSNLRDECSLMVKSYLFSLRGAEIVFAVRALSVDVTKCHPNLGESLFSRVCEVLVPLNSEERRKSLPVETVRSAKHCTSGPNSDISIDEGSHVRYMLVWRWVICKEPSVVTG